MALSECAGGVDGAGRELVFHGTMALPVAAYHDDLRWERVPWHWHDELEAARVTQGRIWVEAAGERVCLRAGEGVFLNGGVLHAMDNADPGQDCRLHSLVFHPRLVGGSPESAFWQRYVSPLGGRQDCGVVLLRPEAPGDAAALAELEAAWQAVAHEPPRWELTARDRLSRLLAGVIETLPPAARPRSTAVYEERVKRMMDAIHRGFAGALTLADIAAAASVSPSEALRCFRRVAGVSPVQYLREYRLQRAAAMLRDTGLSVQEIGAACGFLEHSYFTRAFRRSYGAPPSVWRGRQG